MYKCRLKISSSMSVATFLQGVYASYHENDLSKITHGPEIHEVILITAVRDDDLRATPTYKSSIHKHIKELFLNG